jgi:hypothetical protein
MSIGSFLSRIGGNFRDNVEAAPPEAWYSLAQALQGNTNLAQGLGQGLAGFGSELQAAKKKKGLAAVFEDMAKNVPEAERPIFQALAENNPEALMGGYAKKLFEQPGDNQTSDIKNYEYAVQQGFKGTYFDFKNQLAMAGAGVVPVPVPGVGNVNPKTGQIMPGGPAPSPQLRPTLPGPGTAPPQPAPRPMEPPPGVAPDRPGVFFDPKMHPELGDGMMPPNPNREPILEPVAKLLNLSSPPQGQRWVYGDDMQPMLEDVPGYKPQMASMPAELSAKIGLAEGFLKNYRKLESELGELGSVTGRVAGAFNTGRAGEMRRQIRTGAEALVRVLTGAGKSESEARDQVTQYLPDELDTAFTLRSKLKGLRYDLENTIGAVMKPYGGWTSPAGADPAAAEPLPSSPLKLVKDKVYETAKGPARYIGNGKFSPVTQ